jgi:AcrR family transcriptional regulator
MSWFQGTIVSSPLHDGTVRYLRIMSLEQKRPPRDRVLDTAAALFYEHGVRGVSVDRIVAESGVSKMTLYRHFPGKSDLLVATLKERDLPMRSLLEAVAGGAGEAPLDQILGLFKRLEPWFASPGFSGCRFANASIEVGGEDAVVRDIVRQHKEQIRAFLERLARSAGLVRPAELSRELMLVYDGGILTAAMQGDPAVARAMATATQAIVDAHTAVRPTSRPKPSRTSRQPR